MPAHLEYVGKEARLDEAARILEADGRLVACSGREDHVRLVARTEELPKSQAGRERSLAVAAGDAQHAPLVDPLAVAVHARELLDEAPLPGLKLERLPCGRPLRVDEVAWEEVGGRESPQPQPADSLPGSRSTDVLLEIESDKRRWRFVSAAWRSTSAATVSNAALPLPMTMPARKRGQGHRAGGRRLRRCGER
jgi:hypothetical protein